ncbi:hypothetical protein ACQEV2_16630 [Streptomyces sp. CA-251387]|uniref:hypothetical protein n=1 Tax=Streptomyces sp. CA-251387 TaxID=3240064 RepID=UPI003D8E8ADF
MDRTRASATAALTVAAACAALLTGASSAQAATSYVGDDCSSSGNKKCFRIHYNSRSETTTQSRSACLATNRSRSDHYGYSPNGASYVRWVFRSFPSDAYGGMYHPCDPTGDGQGVYHNAASAWNQDPYAAYAVYSETGYGGQNKWYPKADGYARNLGSGIKNHNGAHKRYA